MLSAVVIKKTFEQNVEKASAFLRWRNPLRTDFEQAIGFGGLDFRPVSYTHLVEVTLPPLRDRPEDLPLLVEHFISQLAPYLDVPRLALDARTLARMVAYEWSGNIRELKNFVERSLIPVSYTHLDVYKRQMRVSCLCCRIFQHQ